MEIKKKYKQQIKGCLTSHIQGKSFTIPCLYSYCYDANGKQKKTQNTFQKPVLSFKAVLKSTDITLFSLDGICNGQAAQRMRFLYPFTAQIDIKLLKLKTKTTTRTEVTKVIAG